MALLKTSARVWEPVIITIIIFPRIVLITTIIVTHHGLSYTERHHHLLLLSLAVHGRLFQHASHKVAEIRGVCSEFECRVMGSPCRGDKQNALLSG